MGGLRGSKSKSERTPLVKDRTAGGSNASVGKESNRWVFGLLAAESLHFSKSLFEWRIGVLEIGGLTEWETSVRIAHSKAELKPT